MATPRVRNLLSAALRTLSGLPASAVGLISNSPTMDIRGMANSQGLVDRLEALACQGGVLAAWDRLWSTGTPAVQVSVQPPGVPGLRVGGFRMGDRDSVEQMMRIFSPTPHDWPPSRQWQL